MLNRTITKRQLMTDRKYRSMSLKELVRVVNYDLYFQDYKKLPGNSAEDKAALLLEKWNSK